MLMCTGPVLYAILECQNAGDPNNEKVALS